MAPADAAVVQLVPRKCFAPVPLWLIPVLTPNCVTTALDGVVAPIVVLSIVELVIAALVNLANPYAAITAIMQKQITRNIFFNF